jgi:hypothetical protein
MTRTEAIPGKGLFVWVANHIRASSAKQPEILAKLEQARRIASDSSPQERPRFQGLSLRLRGRDSNPNFLIQSQASYH